MPRVVILQEYIPAYRVPFFKDLRQRCARDGIDLVVACGVPNPQQSLRGDEAGVDFAAAIQQREWTILGRRVVLRQVRDVIRGADLVILEQARRNLDAYRLLMPRRRGAQRFALWGHGKDYTKPTRAIDRIVQRLLTRRAAWFFAYTDGGRSSIVSDGYDPAKVTVVQNSIDTSALRRSIIEVGEPEIRQFCELHDLRGKTAFFLGALDDSKRLPFLVAAATDAHNRDPDFRLLVAGDGPLREWVANEASLRPWLIYLGIVAGQFKAQALASSQVLAMPGRVGLVSVDSFAAGIPIVSTKWPWHAPEFEYLENGVNAVISEDDVTDYARALRESLGDPRLLLQLRQAGLSLSREITIEKMSQNFLQGIRRALDERMQ